MALPSESMIEFIEADPTKDEFNPASALPSTGGDIPLSDQIPTVLQDLIKLNRHQTYRWPATCCRHSEGRSRDMPKSIRSYRTNKTATSAYDSSAITPVVHNIIPTDALVFHHGQLRRHIRG